MIIVSDSTILIGLAKIEKINFLQNIFQNIYVPECVFREIVEEGEQRPGAKIVKEALWIIKKQVVDYTQVYLLMTSLERGEAEVLVLSKEIKADLVLLDEEKARKSAIMAGFKVMGIIGILLIAKRIGLISNIRTYIEKLQREKFRLSKKIVNKALKEANEAELETTEKTNYKE